VPVSDADGAPDVERLPERATYRQVFAVREFRALWIAQILSIVGDQLARVALTLLVFDRTHSPLLAAVTFTASVVPTFLGGVLLSGVADKLPRRQVMIVCDLSRALLIAVMTLPAMPIGVLVGLLFVVTGIGAPFSSARAALYPDILSEDRYILGSAITLTTIQFAQVLGFAAGGAAVAFLGVRASLWIDAATFLVSALITRLLVRDRSPERVGDNSETVTPAGLMAGLRLVFAHSDLRIPMLFGWLVAFYDAPEGISAPLAHSLGGGAVAVGMILAASALGASVGALSFGRFVPASKRLYWMGPLATAACGVLILFAFHPPLVLVLVILAVSGLFDCFQVVASTTFVRAVPPAQRSQAFGIAQGGMSLGQGLAMILAGAAAERYAPADVIALIGAIGAMTATVLAVRQARIRQAVRLLLRGLQPQLLVRMWLPLVSLLLAQRSGAWGQPQLLVRMARAPLAVADV
jgi:MFS family permease